MSDGLILDDLFRGPVVDTDCSDWGMLINEKPALTPVYRIQDRDERNGPRCKMAEGGEIRFSRIVARVGYEFGVHSITKTEWWQAGLEITAKRTELPAEYVQKVIIALSLSAPFKNLRRQIYDEKIRPLTQHGTLRNVRAMWFFDYPNPQTGRILGHVTRLTGIRQPGRPDGDGGWDPPTLEQSHPQRLYKVWNESDFLSDREVLVYPEDATLKARR